MGNWDVDVDGNIDANKTLNLLTLTGANSIIGRAVVIHNATDNCAVTTSAGGRLAFCVIGISNMTNNMAASGATVVNATCVMMPTSAAVVGQSPMGQVWFTQMGNNVVVKAHFTGISNSHGFHVHQFGYTTADGTGSGGHWNPAGVNHGIPTSGFARHTGDMGNIFYYVSTDAYYSLTNDLLTLSGANSIIGRMVHIHQNIDNCGGLVGNAGSRIGQCVIGIANPGSLLTLPDGVPATQDSSACASTVYMTSHMHTDEADMGAVMNIIPSIVLVVLLVVAFI